MEKLMVNLGEKSYNILFTDDFDGLISAMRQINAPKKILIVTDSNVEKLYGRDVERLLAGNGYDVALHKFNAGEESKSMKTILGICKSCINHNMDRKSMIIALGGGVVGDMAGFAASIFMRGIDFIQIPTTLLSQSDSSVGGKTGIDFMECKNILGAFHQPKLVYINVATLKTLPEEQIISGMGEVIKHGIIGDKIFFGYLENSCDKVKLLESRAMIRMSQVNCTIKAKVVEQDEKESGLRANLNFGHTIGHAIESAFNFKRTHGECVGLGVLAASYIAYKRDIFSRAELFRVERLLEMYNFRTRIILPDKSVIFDYMQNDKKKTDGKLKFILPVKIGEVIQTTDVTKEEIEAALEYITN